MRKHKHTPEQLAALLAAVALLANACGSGSSTGPGGSGGRIASSYSGVLVEGFEWGVLSIDVSSVAGNPRAVGGLMVLGTANLAADSFPLAGTLDTLTDTLRLGSSRTSNLKITGVLSAAGDQIQGGSIGLGANGWLAMYPATGTPLQLYCGYWGLWSPWYVVAKGTQLIGAAAGESGDGGPLTGSLSGTSVTLSFHGTYGTATGVAQDTVMHGNWHDSSYNGSGTFYSGTKRCP